MLFDQDESEARGIGQAVLDLSARLPDQRIDRGDGEQIQADMYLSYDAADEVWEIEYCALDPKRNFLLQDRDLLVLVERALARDREAAPDV